MAQPSASTARIRDVALINAHSIKGTYAATEIEYIDISSVGTVEFIVDGSGQFFFTEIKPRIQIEPLVTEMVSSIDLVREQLRVAAGEGLPVAQSQVRLRGHAMACRITAEDPLNDFRPVPGHLRPPLDFCSQVGLDR